jgi:hypothetical protein
MSRDVCGICWCPYDEEGKCGCENVQVINPAPTKVMWGTCIRCGKPVRSDDDIHTCTPKAMQMADELYRHGTLNNPTEAADELVRLYEENSELLGVLKHARDLVAEWGACASAYEKERYGLELDLKQLNAAIQRAEKHT